ncbi:putative transcription factor GRF family [Medicago truncatula]|uniref:Putative transcription factor GRF family n=1 Tax=Medicago truncatula TaxID=3880 RepID=A0A396GJC5_MEDTR|nr:putative transcription factor GRF family [Medicago truncatula]
MSTVSQNSKFNPSEGGNSSIDGSVMRMRSFRECGCGEKQVLRTVTDVSNPNYGKKFWGCVNYKNQFDKGCNYFNWFDFRDDIIDAKDKEIEKLKKKNLKLKNALASYQKLLKISIGFGILSFGIILVLLTMLLCNQNNVLGKMYLK